MTLWGFLVLLVIAGIAGAIGQAIVGWTRGGCLASIAIGFIGALIGTWLARVLGLPEPFAIRLGTATFPLVWSIAGAALFVALISLFAGRRPA